MAVRGYTSAVLVEQELATDLTEAQIARMTDLIESVESFIDTETGRVWAVTSPITGELHTLTSPYVYLKHSPVTAVTSVTIRPQSVGGAMATLSAGTGYELLDPSQGILLIAGYGSPTSPVINTVDTNFTGYLLAVSYTTTSSVPFDIRRAATLLVADAIAARSDVGFEGVESYSIVGSGDEFQVKFRSDGNDSPRGSEARRILRSREALIVA